MLRKITLTASLIFIQIYRYVVNFFATSLKQSKICFVAEIFVNVPNVIKDFAGI